MSRDRYRNGTVFQLKGRKTWRIQYYHDGRRYTESAADERTAKRLLNTRLRALGRGAPLDAVARRATLEDALALLRSDYAAKENRSLDRALIAAAHLGRFFARVPLHAIDYEAVTRYIAARLAGEKAPDGTVVRRAAAHGTVASEMAILGRCLTLAARAHYIAVRPPLPRVGGPDRARQGFFEPAQAEAVFAHLPEPIAQMMRFCLLTGWRTGAARTLGWRDVNFDLGVVRLDPRHSKNKTPVVFPFIPPLAAVLRSARDATSLVERASGTICPWVFHRNGRPIKDYRGAWEIACRHAGVPGKIPHDFRRTAARNMIRSGVPERIAMQLLGHRTRAIFDRYCIVSEADLNTAAARLAAQYAAEAASASANNTGTTVVPTADLSPARCPQSGVGTGS